METTLVLDIPAFNSIFDSEKFIQNFGDEISSFDRRNATVSFIEEGDYGKIVQRAWDSIQGLDSGMGRQNLVDIYRLALNRINKESGDKLKKSEQKKKLVSRSYLLKQNVYNYISKYKDQFGLSFPKRIGEKNKFNPELSLKIHDAYENLLVDNSANNQFMIQYKSL